MTNNNNNNNNNFSDSDFDSTSTNTNTNKKKTKRLNKHQSYEYMHGAYPIFLRYTPGWVKMFFMPESRFFRNPFREYPTDMVRTNGGLSFFLSKYILINILVLLICDLYLNETNTFLYTQYILVFFLFFCYIYRSFKLYLQYIIKIKYIAEDNLWVNRFFLLVHDKLRLGKRYIFRTYPTNIAFCLQFLYDKSIPKVKKYLFLLYLIIMLYCIGSYILVMFYSVPFEPILEWTIIYILKKKLLIVWYYQWLFLIKYTTYWILLYLFIFSICYNSIFEFSNDTYLDKFFNYNEMLNSTVYLVICVALYVIYGPWWMLTKHTGVVLVVALFPKYNYFSFIDI